MSTGTLTREEKVAEAQRLRDEGLKLREIADRLGLEGYAGIAAVWRMLHPEKLAEQNRRRRDYKRRWERETAGRCACGAPLSNRRAERCRDCEKEERRQEALERTEHFIALRREGLLDWQIAEREGVSPSVVATVFYQAARYGLDPGRSPYHIRGAA